MAPASLLLESEGDGRQAEGPALERFVQRDIGGFGPVVVTQTRKLDGGLGERDLALEQPLEEGLGVGKLLQQPIASLRCPGGALARDQRLDVAGIFDRAASVVAARVARDLHRSIEDADLVVASDQREGLAHELGRDRVVVAIETQVRRLAAGLGFDPLALEGVLGQRKQPRTLLLERLRHALLGIAGARPRMGPLGPPAQELGVEILDVAERPCGKEAIAEEADLALDASLLVAPRHVARPRQEVVVAGELEQSGMELDGTALACQNGGLEVVVEKRPGGSAKGGEGFDVTPQEALHRLVEREEDVEGTRPAEHHDEGGERALCTAYLDVPEVTPIDLCLLAGKGPEPEVGFGRRAGTQASHEPPCLLDGAPIAPGNDHLVDARGAKPGVVLERGADELGVGVEGAGAHDRAVVEACRLEGGAHRVGVKRELARNRADAPVLGVEEAADLGALGFVDHEPPPSPRAGPSSEARADEVSGRGMTTCAVEQATTRVHVRWSLCRSCHRSKTMGRNLRSALLRRRNDRRRGGALPFDLA